MITSDQAFDRLIPIFAMMNKSLTCQSVVDNSDGTYTFACNNTKWALPGYDITILSNSYTIVDVIFNTSITISGAVLPIVLTFDLNQTFFKHGTIKRVAQEQTSIPDYKQRLPLCLLKEFVEEAVNLDAKSSIDTNADCVLFFLASCNLQDWDQNQGDEKVIKPMRAFCNEFIRVLSNNQYVAELTGIGNIRSFIYAGNTDDNGTPKNMLNEPLGGVQLRITIPFFKEYCCDDLLLEERPAPGYVLDASGNILAILYSNEYYTVTPGQCAGVTITDQDGNILRTVASGGNYPVTVLTTIEDTIDSNVATIIENLT